MVAHHRRHHPLRVASPALLTFTGRTKYTLSAFGEHLISEEVERAIATAAHRNPLPPCATGTSALSSREPSATTATSSNSWNRPRTSPHFRAVLDADLCHRNADYKAHRAEGVGLPLPAIVVASKGGFEAWMRSRGKVGGQNKVPRMDNSGAMTAQLVGFLRENGHEAEELAPA